MANKLNAPISFEEIAQRSANQKEAQERKQQMLRNMLTVLEKDLWKAAKILVLDAEMRKLVDDNEAWQKKSIPEKIWIHADWQLVKTGKTTRPDGSKVEPVLTSDAIIADVSGLPSWYILAVALSGQPLRVRISYEGDNAAGHIHPLTVPDPKDNTRAAKFVPQSKHGGPGAFRFGMVVVRPNSVFTSGPLAGEIDINGVVGAKLYDKQGRVAYCEGVGVSMRIDERQSDLTKACEELNLQEIGQFRGWRYRKLSPKDSINKLYAIRRFIGGYRLAQEEPVAEEIPTESTPVLEEMEIPDEPEVEVLDDVLVENKGDDEPQTETARVEA